MATFTSKFNIGDEVYYFFSGKVRRSKIRKISVNQNGVTIDVENNAFPVLESDVSYTDNVFESKIKEYQKALLKENIERHLSDIKNWQERIRITQLGVKNLKAQLKKLVDSAKI